MDAYEASISHRLVSSGRGRDLFSSANLQVTRMEMSNEIGSPIRDDQAFWRAHHEAWQHSALNHRQYCEPTDSAEGFRQLASEVQSGVAVTGSQTALRAPGLRSYP